MRAVRLNEFMKKPIPARAIAEALWGSGGTTAYRTNRRGAYYYSCSGHGGYVVDGRVLNARERQNIDNYTRPIPIRLLVQNSNGYSFVLGVCLGQFTGRPRAHRYHLSFGSVAWRDLPVYVFEEDCDWAILEHYTDIRAEGCLEPKTKASIGRAFKRWCRPIEPEKGANVA